MRTRKLATITALAIPIAFGGYSRLLHAQPPANPAALYDDDHRDNRDAREMGHRDGMRAASEDLRDGRRVDADRHESYRHPPVDKHAQNEYRAGFRDGYQDGIRNGRTEGFRDYDRR
jgi:hypothetical protein